MYSNPIKAHTELGWMKINVCIAVHSQHSWYRHNICILKFDGYKMVPINHLICLIPSEPLLIWIVDLKPRKPIILCTSKSNGEFGYVWIKPTLLQIIYISRAQIQVSWPCSMKYGIICLISRIIVITKFQDFGMLYPPPPPPPPNGVVQVKFIESVQ